MKDTATKNGHTSGVSPVAIVVGAAVGAGAAVAIKYAMKDERTKKKVNEVITSVKDQTLDYVESFTSQRSNGKSQNTPKSLTEGIKREGMKAPSASDSR